MVRIRGYVRQRIRAYKKRPRTTDLRKAIYKQEYQKEQLRLARQKARDRAQYEARRSKLQRTSSAVNTGLDVLFGPTPKKKKRKAVSFY